MRIKQLQLTAFGPFSGLLLDFQDPGMHVVYGRNEAGKSTALRGLRSLLYGIDERTTDNFRHANDKLRLGGQLLAADNSRELAIVRRKGRKNTLMAVDGEVLDEQELAPFLQGVGEALFRSLFGIDHRALAQGGKEILEQQGEVGQALFSAALGSHALHALLDQLDAEADSLFRPRASNRKINRALKAYPALRAEIRDLSLSSRDWNEHRRMLESTSRDLAATSTELDTCRAELNRLQRVQRLLPRLARQGALQQQLDLLRDTVIVADDFSERRRSAATALTAAQAVAAGTRPRLEELRAQLDGLKINVRVLERADEIEQLHARLNGQRQMEQERPQLEAQRRHLLAQADALLREVRPDLGLEDMGQLRPLLSKRSSITEMGGEQALLVADRERSEVSRVEASKRLEAARREREMLPVCRACDRLREEIAAAGKQGDVDQRLAEAEAEIEHLQIRCRNALSRLGLWRGELEALPGLALPGRETVDHFQDRCDELTGRVRQLREQRETLASELQQTSARLDEIKGAGEVPEEADLIKIRSDRDRVWQLLRRRWVDGEDVAAEAHRVFGKDALHQVFEKRLSAADALSDRLRREADRVQEVARYRGQRNKLLRQSEQTESCLQETFAQQAQLDADWIKLWDGCGIKPRSPREMRAWLDQVSELQSWVERLVELSQRRDDMRGFRRARLQRLNEELVALEQEQSSSEQLSQVLVRCQEAVRRLDEDRHRSDLLEKTIGERETEVEMLTADCETAATRLERWRIEWVKLMQRFGLEQDTSPSLVSEIIDKLSSIATSQAEAEKLQLRLSAIDRDSAAFSSRSAEIAAAAAPELAALPATETAVRLNGLLSENRASQSRYRQVEAQLLQAQQELRFSESEIRTMSGRLDALCKEAGCEDHSQLERAERQSAEYLDTKTAITRLETEILELGGGASPAALVTELRQEDADRLPGRIEALQQQIDGVLEPRRAMLLERKGRQQKELELMDGSDKVAVLADRAQSMLAGIRSDAEHYSRVKLAARILRNQVERYRAQNQGPLVQCASGYFAALTLDSFQGLRADVDAKDQPVLVGVRPGGERVYVEGMSAGTRDQLYLSLRLASLEKYLQGAAPMPFIVDDILVDFDDRRSAAALSVLSDFSDRTQVILFTHHRSVVEQAGDLQRPVRIHELQASA